MSGISPNTPHATRLRKEARCIQTHECETHARRKATLIPFVSLEGGAMSSQEAITQFVTLFVVIDPAATIPMFLITVEGLTRVQARMVAMIAAAIAFIVLLFFIAFFQLLLEAMHIPLPSFQ